MLPSPTTLHMLHLISKTYHGVPRSVAIPFRPNRMNWNFFLIYLADLAEFGMRKKIDFTKRGKPKFSASS